MTKSFGDLVLFENISLGLSEGQRVGLIAKNGSGKTTLLNILSGKEGYDNGTISFRRDLRVGYLEQDPQYPEELTVLEACFHHGNSTVELIKEYERCMETEGHPGLDEILVRMDHEKAWEYEQKAKQILSQLKIRDFSQHVKHLSGGQLKRVALANTLITEPDLLILDEPTAVLTPQETRRLFDILRRMKQEGCAIIIITHKLHEVLEISDRVVILRKGESVGSVITKDADVKQLTELMVGRSVKLEIERTPRKHGKRLLEVSKLCVKNEDGLPALTDVAFELESGEILGVAGIAGSGQRELCESIAGLHEISFGNIKLEGQDLEGLDPREIMKRGIAMSFVPEDRLGMGLVGSMSVSDNVLLKSYHNNHGMFVDRAAARSLSRKMVDELEISTPSVMHPVGQLSGGNVQKVLLGREIHLNPKVLLVAYPVRGLDINSSYKIYELINAQKEKGVGVLFIGEDLDVLIELCDRIMVLCAGRITGMIDVRAELGESENEKTVSREDEDSDSQALKARQHLKERLGALMTGFVEEDGANE